MSLRRIPPGLHPRLRVAYAGAWEALVEAHSLQLVDFVEEFTSRVPVLDALELYFRVVASPEAMREQIRTRTLVHLDLEALAPTATMPMVSGWRVVRIDLVLRAARQRREYHDRTMQLARLVGARAAQAVGQVHLHNALHFARLLKGVMPVDRALEQYVREFALPLTTAATVIQQAQAALVQEHLEAQVRELPPVEPHQETQLLGQPLTLRF
ncbi:MAG: hypothetical protein ACREL6_03655 [Gemmatimonadales bacterium]